MGNERHECSFYVIKKWKQHFILYNSLHAWSKSSWPLMSIGGQSLPYLHFCHVLNELCFVSHYHCNVIVHHQFSYSLDSILSAWIPTMDWYIFMLILIDCCMWMLKCRCAIKQTINKLKTTGNFLWKPPWTTGNPELKICRHPVVAPVWMATVLPFPDRGRKQKSSYIGNQNKIDV